MHWDSVMDKCISFILMLNVLNVVTAMRTYIEGYYWRDFEGITPEDAIPGGLDQNGRPIYIGQVLFENKLVPGKIYENDNHIYYEWNQKEAAATKNVKILCSQYPEKFEWLPTKHDELVRLTNKLLIKGGYEPNYSTYIGRVYADGETSVGKIICRETHCLGLYITKDGKGTEHRAAFEVMSYNPKINITDINCRAAIDVRTIIE